MCVKTPDKLNKILERQQEPGVLRKFLEDEVLCSTCLYQDRTETSQSSGCLIFHSAKFRNRLSRIAKELNQETDPGHKD